MSGIDGGYPGGHLDRIVTADQAVQRQWPSEAAMLAPGRTPHEVTDFLAHRVYDDVPGSEAAGPAVRTFIADALAELISRAQVLGASEGARVDQLSATTAASFLRLADLLAQPFGWGVQPKPELKEGQ